MIVPSHTTASSNGGNTTFATTSAALNQTVNKASTSTVVVSSVNPSNSGQNVTFTATISITAPGVGILTGTVQFQIDGSNAGSPVGISITGGVTTASFSTTTQTVGKASSTTAVVSSVNPSTRGQAVTFTATVTGSGPGNPTGIVTFSDGGTNIGQGTLSTSGSTTTASFTTSTLAGGNHTITAS